MQLYVLSLNQKLQLGLDFVQSHVIGLPRIELLLQILVLVFALFEGLNELADLGFFLRTEISEHDFVVIGDALERGFLAIVN